MSEMLLRRSNNNSNNYKHNTIPSLFPSRKGATVRNGASVATNGGPCISNRNLLRQVGIFVIFVCFVLVVLSGHKYENGYVTPSDLSMLNIVADGLDTVASGLERDVVEDAAQSSTGDRRKAFENQDLNNPDNFNNDKDCIFQNSPIYRKVFVYPNPGELGWEGDLLTEHGRNLTAMQWPWLAIDAEAKRDAQAHYDVDSQNVQYTTELLVRELMINPKSCLRTYNPEEATLFYVPYLPSTEHHVGHRSKTDYTTSPYGAAILEILDNQNYEPWERVYGLTSKYWKRRGGSDHILVFSEPMHGLYHPRNKRGNFHFIHSQKQLKPPIVISVELSTTFVKQYPHCAAKNILVPYPNTHGNFFNGVFAKEAEKLLQQSNVTVATSSVALPAEQHLYHNRELTSNLPPPRPVAQFYQAGLHGTCTQLRKAMKADYQQCAPSHQVLSKILERSHFSTAMRVATFCPCPGGDSPSAKRHFDALISGCIPIILSSDFVWPFTKEFDPFSLDLDPNDFSIRLAASDYDQPLLDSQTCQPLDPAKPGLQALLENMSADELARLRQGVAKAGQLYSWYKTDDPTLPINPLRDGVLPNGGTAHWVVQALAERAEGHKWPACQEELQLPHGDDARQFKC